MTNSSKKTTQASIEVHEVLGLLNGLIASEDLQEGVIGKRMRGKLVSVREIVYGLLENLEERS